MADQAGARPPLKQTQERANPLVRVKLPLWVTLLVAVALVVVFLVLLAGKKTVTLGPAIKGSEVNMCILLADPRSSINPATEERNVEKALTDLGARVAHARIQRPPDACPSVPAPAPTPSPSPS
jgi:hypothetical protein